MTFGIALVGCGAISEDFYLPALAKRRDYLSRLWLVDPTPARLVDIADRFGIARDRTVARIEDLPAGVKAAFNATPSHLHLPTTLALLRRGIRVFVEKPLGETAAEGEEIVAVAGKENPVAVSQYRRRVPSFMEVKRIIESGEIGAVRRIVWNEGNKMAWPAQSPFYFRRPWVGGRPRGTLLDTGSHIIDLLCWWLGGELEVVDAQCDGYAGPEEFVRARLARDGAEADISISMHVRMANRFLVEGDRGSVEGAVMDFRRVVTSSQGTKRIVALKGNVDRADIADEFVSNFIAACEGRTTLLIDAESVLPSLRTIDAIYRQMEAPLPTYYKEWQA